MVWHFVSLLLPISPAVGLTQPQMGPVLVPGVLRQRDPSPAALTMQTWAGLKEAMDSIGGEVQQVLLVRQDLAMLQEDLRQQEEVWRQAEEDLSRQIEALQAHADQLQAEVDKGSPIGPIVTALQKQVDDEKERADTSKKLFEHEAMLAGLEEQQLQIRHGQLQARLEGARSRAEAEAEVARREEADEAESEAALQREVSRLKDRAVDEASALNTERSLAQDRCDLLRRDIEDAKTTIEHLEVRLVPPSLLEARVAAMEAQVQLETRQLSEVLAAKEQAATECDARSAQVREAHKAEKAKALQRHVEMVETCDTAEQKNVLLKSIVTEACAPLSTTPIATTSPLPPSSTLGFASPAPAPVPAAAPSLPMTSAGQLASFAASS